MTKILIIEDELPVRANISELLTAEDYDVLVAENGRVGVQSAQDQLPDLIICDMMMPELDGRDVLSTLRKNPKTSAIPFIFLTARADRNDVRLGMQMGADDYLTKPFSRKELLGTIETRLTKYEAMCQRYERQHQDDAHGSDEPTQDVVELQQQLQDLKQCLAHKNRQLKVAQAEVAQITPTLATVTQLLQEMEPSVQRDRCLNLLQKKADLLMTST